MYHTKSAPTLHCKCPACGSDMQVHTLDSMTGGKVEIDVCYDCNAIWFDQMESTRLAPDGVVELFSLIHQRGKTSAPPFPAKMTCVRCKDKLFEVSDIARQTRFKYQRCPTGHGRLTTFYHFLAEKQFVRELSPPERQRLCATIKQIKCSSCGATVDVSAHTACPYCRAPITVLDKHAAEKALEHYWAMRKTPGAASAARRTDGARPSLQGVPYEGATAPTRHATGWAPFDTADLGLNAVAFLASLAGRRLVAAGLGYGAATSAVAGDAATGTLDALASPALELLPMDNADARNRLTQVLDGGAQAAEVGVDSLMVGESFLEGASEASSGLLDGAVDLVGDGIGAILEGLGSLF